MIVIDKFHKRVYECDMTRLRHFDNLGTARFVTFSCFQRHPYLLNESCIQTVLDEVTLLRNDYNIRILGYVIMPDHVHLVLLPPDDIELGRLIGRMKGRSAHAMTSLAARVLHRSDWQSAVWERRCYDHNCRTAETVREKIIYCHKNPVSKGLVDLQDEWPWSSYRWYQGDRNVPLEIDGFAL